MKKITKHKNILIGICLIIAIYIAYFEWWGVYGYNYLIPGKTIHQGNGIVKGYSVGRVYNKSNHERKVEFKMKGRFIDYLLGVSAVGGFEIESIKIFDENHKNKTYEVKNIDYIIVPPDTVYNFSIIGIGQGKEDSKISPNIVICDKHRIVLRGMLLIIICLAYSFDNRFGRKIGGDNL